MSCTYVGLYGSDFGFYVSFPTLLACFLGFDIPTSSFIFIENVFFLLFLFPLFFFLNVFLWTAEILYVIMKSYNHKCINICSSIKDSLLYLCIDYHSLSLTDNVYSLFHLQHCLPFYKK